MDLYLPPLNSVPRLLFEEKEEDNKVLRQNHLLTFLILQIFLISQTNIFSETSPPLPRPKKPFLDLSALPTVKTAVLPHHARSSDSIPHRASERAREGGAIIRGATDKQQAATFALFNSRRAVEAAEAAEAAEKEEERCRKVVRRD